MDFRHEYKLAINEADRLSLRQGLRAVAQGDAHAGEDGRYKIRSLYFDNFNDKALREKTDGVDDREKFRLRYYNNDASFVVLEKKSKLHGLCQKRQSRLLYEEVLRLLNGDHDFLLAGDALQREFYLKLLHAQLRPRVIVDYWREPFLYAAGNVRITIDSEIRTGLYSRSFFDADLPMVQAGDSPCLLEVKFDEFLPDVLVSLLQIGSRQVSAFSKYAAGRRFG